MSVFSLDEYVPPVSSGQGVCWAVTGGIHNNTGKKQIRFFMVTSRMFFTGLIALGLGNPQADCSAIALSKKDRQRPSCSGTPEGPLGAVKTTESRSEERRV